MATLAAIKRDHPHDAIMRDIQVHSGYQSAAEAVWTFTYHGKTIGYINTQTWYYMTNQEGYEWLQRVVSSLPPTPPAAPLPTTYGNW
jgi:hypothetical protein